MPETLLPFNPFPPTPVNPNPNPNGPTQIYELDWDAVANSPQPFPDYTPQGWSGEYYYPLVSPERQVRLATFPRDPVRGGWTSARFELHYDDHLKNDSVRAEISASAQGTDPITRYKIYEPVGAERWYGFSICLPNDWDFDISKEILTQWHHALPNGSPPLAIGTFKDRWMISERDWKKTDNDTVNTSIDPFQTGEWTDWVVQVRWSDSSNGSIKIWMNNENKVVYKNNGQNSYPGLGNYMKFGIYKWDWDREHNPTAKYITRQRVMFHDEIRIADWNSGYQDVVPRQEFTLRPQNSQTYQRIFSPKQEIETGDVLIKGKHFATYTRTKTYWPLSNIFGAALTIDFGLGMMILKGTYGVGSNSNDYSGTVTGNSTYFPGKTFTGSGNVLRI